ncbi:tryptophan--tRNA ligase [Candidatus Berkelbacteria bacterium]|nr:tryptophan--tRNA ligase [Candidatus Berkelbacteria bacterium]
MRILSGIQPSGTLHLGNYLGAIKQHIALQAEADQALYTIVDLHALTVPQDPTRLADQILHVAAMYLACGLNPSHSILFIQSHRPEHAELGWLLGTLTKLGELERMTQFKEKGRGEERGSVGVGLLTYPTLMAADILLYQSTHVPVGDDQVQHVELTRDLAERFNRKYGETFTIPEAKLVESGARIMGLDNPTKKMSKSAPSESNYIALTDDAQTVKRKLTKAMTDSGSEITYADDKPALQNLLTIFAGVTDETPVGIASRYDGKGYADFKADLAEVITNFLAPIQERYQQHLQDRAELLNILHTGANRAEPLAQQTLQSAKEKLGLIL